MQLIFFMLLKVIQSAVLGLPLAPVTGYTIGFH